MSLVKELKRRHVFRIGLAYLALGWVVLQFANIFTPILNLPPWTESVLLWIGIVGFPVALWCAWSFEMTDAGLKRTEDVEPGESITGITRSKLNRTIVSFLIAALVLVLAERLFLMRGQDADPPARAEHRQP